MCGCKFSLQNGQLNCVRINNSYSLDKKIVIITSLWTICLHVQQYCILDTWYCINKKVLHCRCDCFVGKNVCSSRIKKKTHACVNMYMHSIIIIPNIRFRMTTYEKGKRLSVNSWRLQRNCRLHKSYTRHKL